MTGAERDDIIVRAAVLDPGSSTLSIGPLHLTPPGPGEVLVELVAVGVCHTDLIMIDGIRPAGPFGAPIVLGHEGSGRVVMVGAGVEHLTVGDAVVLSFCFCGACWNCADGHPGYCDHFRPLNFSGRRADGGVGLHRNGAPVLSEFFGQSSFASHAVVAARSAIRVAARDDEELALSGPLGCGLQTGAGAVLNVLKPQPGDSILIVGVGAVGLAAIMAARIAGCATIIAVDVHQARLDLARTLGATHVLTAPIDDLPAAVRAIVPAGVDTALDTTARADVVAVAFAALRSRGRAAHVGVHGPDLQLSVATSMRGCTLTGVMEGDSDPASFIPALIDHWHAGNFPLERLTTSYAFDDINTAIADMRAGRVIKPILRMRTPPARRLGARWSTRLAMNLTLALFVAPLTAVAGQPATVAEAAPPPPDYALASSWAARPPQSGPAQSVPPNASPAARAPVADVFFIHPTTFRSEQWNARVDDAETNAWTDQSVIARQASVFNGCCRVFAPRYRQASTRAFAERAGEGARAYDLAYGDVLRAFDAYLAGAGDRPFVLAGHSQGASFVMRLLSDRIAGTPLARRLVAAYAVGVPVRRDRLTGVSPCERPRQTGCVLSWNSFLAGSDTSGYVARAIDGDPIERAAATILCNNPAGNRAATALPGAPGPGLPPLRRRSVRATCVGGVLMVRPAADLALPPLPGGNMHFHDLALFYGEVRADAVRRIAAYKGAGR